MWLTLNQVHYYLSGYIFIFVCIDVETSCLLDSLFSY